VNASLQGRAKSAQVPDGPDFEQGLMTSEKPYAFLLY